MTHRIALLPGDGVGPEVMVEARRVVDALGLDLEWTELPWGSAYYHEHGRMMSEDWQDVAPRARRRADGRRSAIRACPTTSRCGARSC